MGSGSAVQAAPNGLTQIPIAKVFGDGVSAFSVAWARQSSDTTVYTAQYGLVNLAYTMHLKGKSQGGTGEKNPSPASSGR
jgi:hypothetical protein